MSEFVTAQWLAKRLEQDTDDLAIVDVRFSLADPTAGKKEYEQAHIPGAVYLDLNAHLASAPQTHGGNHPLPDIEDFAEKLGEIGIDRDTSVVIYDQGNDMFSARLWWLLDYVGHEHVYLLDGGLKRWMEAGNMVTNQIPVPQLKQFEPNVRLNETVDMEEVKAKLARGEATLLDSRATDRYLGKTEPLYDRAGHIPGAENYFWKDVLTNQGDWKSKEALQEHFKGLPSSDEIIVSCGSGVSACPNILGLKLAGYTNVKLYPGSFSDWISYPENDVATDEA